MTKNFLTVIYNIRLAKLLSRFGTFCAGCFFTLIVEYGVDVRLAVGLVLSIVVAILGSVYVRKVDIDEYEEA